MVSGGDALVRVDAPRGLLDKLRVERNGDDVTDAFEREDGGLVGLVAGLELGQNTLAVVANRRSSAPAKDRLTLVNHPTTGPIFSGPHQRPFVCQTIQAGLGEPLVDNQAGEGFRVLNPDGSTAGWSLDCSAETTVDYLYRTTGGEFRSLPTDGSRPADMATTTVDGREVDYVVRRERGTINRFIYSFAMLAPFGEGPSDEPDTSLWNERAIYTFDGGVGIGHRQGTPGGSALYHDGLRQGYAIIHSSGTRASVHYNLVLGGETALMTKEEFVERYGVPRHTVGVGGSGGAIQQYVYGQNHPGLLDAGIPQYSYPDMVTQTIHVGDCELLEHYMDVTDGSNPKWRRLGEPRMARGAQLRRHDPQPLPARGARQQRVRQRVARAHPAGAQPALGSDVQRRRAHGPAGARADPLDPLGGPAQHLRRRAERLRPPDVGQRRRPVRARGADRRQHHAAGVPRPERPGGKLARSRGRGPGGPAVRSAARPGP